MYNLAEHVYVTVRTYAASFQNKYLSNSTDSTGYCTINILYHTSMFIITHVMFFPFRLFITENNFGISHLPLNNNTPALKLSVQYAGCPTTTLIYLR